MPAASESLAPIFSQLARSAGLLVVGDGVAGGLAGEALLDLVGRFAALAGSLGLKPGDRVLVQVPKSVPALALYLAILRVGAVFTPLGRAAPDALVEGVIGDALPTLVVASAGTRAGASRERRTSRVRVVLTLEADGSGSLMDAAGAQTPSRTGARVRASELAMLSYRQDAGTPPLRGAKLSFAALLRQADMVRQHLALTPRDVVAHAVDDWSAPASLALAGAALATGARLLWLAEPTLPDPAATLVVADDGGDGALRGASPASRLWVPAAWDAAPRHASRFLALPETGVLGVTDGAGGAPLLAGGAARLRDAAGGLVEGEGTGHLEVEGEHVFMGYWRRPEATRAAFAGDGFFRTGLRAVRRGDGAIVLPLQP
ncbi:MAG: AMP-binding protein [Hyphomicrobiaceae bacterium]|nr:AMP-binding protein [Hyphomicrobiaceae bacterium]